MFFLLFYSRLSWNKMRDIQKEMDGQNEEWNDEREEKLEPSDGWARRHLGEEVGGGEDGEWEQIKQTKKRKKEKEEGRMVACLNCDRAPRGFWVVHVWVYEHGKKKRVPLQGFVSVYMSEGGGRAGWGGTINSQFSLSARVHRAFWTSRALRLFSSPSSVNLASDMNAKQTHCRSRLTHVQTFHVRH